MLQRLQFSNAASCIEKCEVLDSNDNHRIYNATINHFELEHTSCRCILERMQW